MFGRSNGIVGKIAMAPIKMIFFVLLIIVVLFLILKVGIGGITQRIKTFGLRKAASVTSVVKKKGSSGTVVK